MVGVLQTWIRDLRYHPHVHSLVPGGGLAPDARTWRTAKAAFFVPVKPLAARLRAKVRAALRQTERWSRSPRRRVAPGLGIGLSPGRQWAGGPEVPGPLRLAGRAE